MNHMECPREGEIVEAVTSGRLLALSEAEGNDDLRAHMADCAVCRDVALVAQMFRDDHASLGAHVPPSGRVWWRAEMRARREAAEKAARPMAIAEIAGAASVGGALVAVAALLWPAWSLWMLVFAIGSALLLGPVALYLVLSNR
jgi:hypothetical protein